MTHCARALRVLFILLLALSLLAPSALAAAVHINAQTDVYQSPSHSSRSVTVPRGLSVTLKSASDGWGQVVYKGRTGYIPLKYLTLDNPIQVYAIRQSTIYRDAGSGALGQVAAGTAMLVVGIDGGYARVTNRSGSVTGYINASRLTRNTAEVEYQPQGTASVPAALRSTTTKAGSSKIEYAIYVAQNLVGAPYAESPDPPKTFDCSKFTAYCYGKASPIALPGSARGQGYDDRFVRISSISGLKRGDLVCFETVEDDDQSDHVGIYLGRGYFIHASSSAKKIVVSSLASGYYYQRFSWGRRIFDH